MSHQKTPHLFINCQKNPLKVLYQVSHWDTFSWWHVNKTLTLSHHHQSFEKNFGVKANKNVVSRLPETACWQYWIQSITTFYRTLTHHYLWDNSIMLRNCWDGTKRYYITSMKMILSAPLLEFAFLFTEVWVWPKSETWRISIVSKKVIYVNFAENFAMMT